MGKLWSSCVSYTFWQLQGASPAVCNVVQVGGTLWSAGLRGKHQDLFYIFIESIPLSSSETNVQNLKINFHSQKEWKYVPLSELHLMHGGEMERFILCKTTGVIGSLWRIWYWVCLGPLYVKVDWIKATAPRQLPSIYSICKSFFLIYGQTLHKLEVQYQGVNCILMVNRNGGDMRRLGMNRVHPGHSQENLSIFDCVTSCLFVIL